MRKILVAGMAVVAVGSLALFGVLIAGKRANAEDIERKCLSTIDTTEYEDDSYRQKVNKCLEKASSIDEKQGNYERAIEMLESLGDDNVLIDNDSAEKYYLRALEDVKKIGDKELEARICGKLGDIYKVKGDKQKAKEYYIKAYSDYVAIEKVMGDKKNTEPIGPAEFISVLKTSIKQLDES